MIILYIIGILLILLIVVGWTIKITTDFPLRKKEPDFEYVYVDQDGSVRELYQDEIEYLKMEFHQNDSGRPYIKYRYNQMTPDNKIWGFIKRRRVPSKIKIKPIDQKEYWNSTVRTPVS